jgi:hypothetical protein
MSWEKSCLLVSSNPAFETDPEDRDSDLRSSARSGLVDAPSAQPAEWHRSIAVRIERSEAH